MFKGKYNKFFKLLGSKKEKPQTQTIKSESLVINEKMTTSEVKVAPAGVSLTAAGDAPAVSSLIKEISHLGSNFSADTDEETRLKLLHQARTLWMALETPRETMIRHCWMEVSIWFYSSQ